MSEFQGKTAFLTGAAGGIGLAIVKTLLAEGAKVFATDVSVERLDELACDNLHICSLDVTRSADVDRVIDDIAAQCDGIDFGVCIAGVLVNAAVVDTSDAEWERAFAVNTTGVFHVARALARHMVSRCRGSIVTVSSNAAGIPRKTMAAYAASKAASTMFTRCLGLELAEYGIRCNIVAPGSTLTPMQTGMWSDASGGEQVIKGSLENYKTGIPLRKLATPEDVAHSVLFLLSDKAGHITMADIYVDGGAALHA
ncbi:2,3-dihydro-2,3-dihydroxybenzoate dehydrogenase [Rhizobium sp. SSA_523]|uniref:2,3-dihydro-2,3-dihydroxybenzoate dehydrogenase n=1 Tax=Rhizobium sp. SSA_523 TaxID=2952477 RepID=UPI0020914735|nr:2,3-dihydro-2,3-dihydroxybenzoate dehydrogenase [Rhizobium sp. SSA_523]MCO5732803.1 2,3-dihydro-2,3-dihydroxybenzoate dehydrogenase [Rhizobium sp. SSA_523]WKC23579.1 2,3-dihydro-2,3-dihydroxybenzoate dehydrogenase [Rhizobium sp. SSA_523]